MKHVDITINSILQDLYNIYNINNKGLNSEAMTFYKLVCSETALNQWVSKK